MRNAGQQIREVNDLSLTHKIHCNDCKGSLKFLVKIACFTDLRYQELPSSADFKQFRTCCR